MVRACVTAIGFLGNTRGAGMRRSGERKSPIDYQMPRCGLAHASAQLRGQARAITIRGSLRCQQMRIPPHDPLA